jgi:predicted transcriptional regulator
LRNYRDKFDIIADILKIAKRNPKKTQIMYQANLSYTVLKKYLARIMQSSLISYENEEHCYSLTDKGQKFLVLYEEYSKANNLLQKRAKDTHIKKTSLEKLCLTKNF